jgi:hypothetical protein
MSRLSRLAVLACAVGACALTPSGALAAKHHANSSGQGIVLSAKHGSVQLVDRGHHVADVAVGSTRGLARGAVVSVRSRRAHVTGHVRTVSFLGRVVRSSAHGAVLRLGDGSTFKLAAGKGGHGARAASTVTVNFQGLAPGQALLITIATDEQGNVALTIKVVSAATDIGDGEQQATGVVTDDSGAGSFAIRSNDGSGLRFDDPQQLLDAAQASDCDIVLATYHADGHKLVADALKVTGQSDQGVCADQQSGDEVDGTVTALADDGSSLTVDQGDGSDPLTIPVDDPTVLDGIGVGDDVAVILDDSGTAVEVDLVALGDDSDPTDPCDG